MNRPLLSASGLSKSFGPRRALAGVSFEIQPGEILALLGPTGAGKTSTIRALAGLLALEAGRVELDGRDITTASPVERDLAIVFEGFNLLPVLSVEENIAFPLRSPRFRESEAVIRERVDKAAVDLGIARLLQRRVDQLSGGERQRVAIARALVRRPTLYMFDEPLSALDLKLRESLASELREMHRRDGATMLYATHDYNGAAALGDRLALIEAGRILQVGTLAELLASPRHAGTGRLIGSPAMAFFDADIAADGVLRCAGLPWRWQGPRGRPGRCQLGIWPEHIELSPVARPGHAQGLVHATDYRGLDSAVELRCGTHRLRKAVPLDWTLAQGQACWFALPAPQLFVFDPATGERIDATLTELEHAPT